MPFSGLPALAAYGTVRAELTVPKGEWIVRRRPLEPLRKMAMGGNFGLLIFSHCIRPLGTFFWAVGWVGGLGLFSVILMFAQPTQPTNRLCSGQLSCLRISPYSMI